MLPNQPRVLIRGPKRSRWDFLGARFSATLILSVLGLATVIMFSRWRVGRHSGRRQMSHSQQSLSKAASLSGGKLRPTISILGLALKVHLCISMTAGPVYCPDTSRRDPKGKYDGHMSLNVVGMLRQPQ